MRREYTGDLGYNMIICHLLKVIHFIQGVKKDGLKKVLSRGVRVKRGLLSIRVGHISRKVKGPVLRQNLRKEKILGSLIQTGKGRKLVTLRYMLGFIENLERQIFVFNVVRKILFSGRTKVGDTKEIYEIG